MALKSSTGLDKLFNLSTATSIAFSMPWRKIIGLAPAVKFLFPSLIIACASTDAVVVPSPATSLVFTHTSLISFTPIFS